MESLHRFSILLIFFQALVSSIFAQDTTQNAGFVDFHSHTILKNYYRLNHSSDVDTMSHLNDANWRIFPGTTGKKRLAMNGVNNVDQATFAMLDRAHASIICTSLYTLEKQSISGRRVPLDAGVSWWFAPAKGLAWMLHFFVPMRLINGLLVTNIKITREKEVADSSVYNYLELTRQLKYLRLQAESSAGSRPVRIASRVEDFADTSVIWLVITAEGGHNFYGPLTSRIDTTDHGVMGYHYTEESTNEILSNLKLTKDSLRLFFVTPAHLFENKMVGGGRGLDMDKTFLRLLLTKMMWDPRFAVIDNKDCEGIVSGYDSLCKKSDTLCKKTIVPGSHVPLNFGWRFIHALLDTNNAFHKPTYIDMRHMDVRARSEYMDSVRQWNVGKDDKHKIPLIVSHAAVTGKSRKTAAFFGLSPVFDDYKEFRPTRIHSFYNKQCANCSQYLGFDYVDPFLQKSGWFHPMSANLYDEEITDVYNSNGIIGITLEERALGKNTYNYQQEHRGVCDPEDSFCIAEPFVRNLFYIVEHAPSYKKGADSDRLESWKHVAIGSDFDGIMNPIDICVTSADIPVFYNFLCRNLIQYVRMLRTDGDRILCGKQPRELMNMLFYENGTRFIKMYF